MNWKTEIEAFASKSEYRFVLMRIADSPWNQGVGLAAIVQNNLIKAPLKFNLSATILQDDDDQNDGGMDGGGQAT